MRATSITYTVLIGILLAATGCDSDTGDEVPTVVPAEAFTLRTDLFSAVPAGAGNHFQAAAERLQPASDGFREYLDLARDIAISTQQMAPSRDGDDFVWKATTESRGQSVDFELVATLASTDVVDWFLNVTTQDGEPALDDFEIVRARTLTNGTLGEWNHFAMVNGVRTLIFRGQYGAVGFDRFVGVSAEDTVDLAIAGDSLEYSEFTGDVREFLWFDGDRENWLVVQWRASTKAGWLLATDYNEQMPACWDSSLADVDCE